VADPNRALFETVDLVCVGGCTTGLIVTDPAAGGIRPTRDVDAIVDVTSCAQYTARSDRLRSLGLMEDTAEGAPLCRWRQGNVVVDVMPSDASILGFSNRWDPTANRHRPAARSRRPSRSHYYSGPVHCDEAGSVSRTRR
jgi:hypothetical protein